MVGAISGAKTGPDHADAYPLLAIVGPTASGKSALALAVAGRCDGEIVNFDSVQVYRGFDIGTGKLAAAERRGIPHHLLDCVEADEAFTAGDYKRQAALVVAKVRERGKLPILVGGTGLYLRALLVGLFEGPARSEALRGRLSKMAERRGREFLHRILGRLDPESAARIMPRDTQKIIRALEVRLLAGRPISRLHASGREGLRGFRVFRIGLNPDRAELNRRINARVERMFRAGLVEETRGALRREQKRAEARSRVPALGALGYRQACDLLEGKLTREEAVLKTQAATRQYAKRQMTWFRREADVEWFAGFGDDPEIQRRVFEWLKGVGNLGWQPGEQLNSPR